MSGRMLTEVPLAPCRILRPTGGFSKTLRDLADVAACYTRPMATKVAHAVVSPQLREQLEQLAARGDRSVAAEIRRALRRHIQLEQLEQSDSEQEQQ